MRQFGVAGKRRQQTGTATAASGRPSSAGRLSLLSARERLVLALVAEGAADQRITERLFISARTVGSHLDRIRGKTGCRRCSEPRPAD
jgi:DNA-binding CsgD family transcriptional regulator